VLTGDEDGTATSESFLPPPLTAVCADGDDRVQTATPSRKVQGQTTWTEWAGTRLDCWECVALSSTDAGSAVVVGIEHRRESLSEFFFKLRLAKAVSEND